MGGKRKSCIACDRVDNKSMIMCDGEGCGSWLHYRCAKLSGDEKKAINEMVYLCMRCKGKGDEVNKKKEVEEGGRGPLKE